MLFKSSVCLLIFCVVVLFLIESRVSKSPTIIFGLSISPSTLTVFTPIFWGSIVRCLYVCNCHIFLMDLSFYHCEMSFFVSGNNFVLKSILSDIRIATPTIFWLVFAWYNFSHPTMFKLFVSLSLNCLSCR